MHYLFKIAVKTIQQQQRRISYKLYKRISIAVVRIVQWLIIFLVARPRTKTMQPISQDFFLAATANFLLAVL